MTFNDLDDGVRSEIEQLGWDAGCSWIEDFREERGRDPEPEECDEEALATAEKLADRQAKAILKRHGIELADTLLRDVQLALSRQFVEALEV
ncbi:MAG: hypothetical protein AAGA48_23385 [Myxococcota bacterium]